MEWVLGNLLLSKKFPHVIMLEHYDIFINPRQYLLHLNAWWFVSKNSESFLFIILCIILLVVLIVITTSGF